MEEEYALLDELDRWFASWPAPWPELTEEEMEVIERGAVRRPLDDQGL